MASQRHNPRRAKTLLCYSIGEAAELYQVHPQTVRNWKKQGLRPIDGARPELYHGSALNHFHASQRCARKQVCAPGEIYCFGCRVPRSPALGMAEYVPLTATTGSISAICPDCHRMMTQRVNATRLAVFRTKVEVTVRLDDERLARQDGIYGINIGDTTNNWTGRLMRLYAKQEASESQAKRLAEWFMFDAGVKWLCWILGNHDDWNGGADFHKRLGGGHIPIIDWRAQFEIAHPSGSTARIDASHGRKGSSIWNNLHATLRAAKLGELADLYVTGHTHSFGLEDLEIPERAMSCWLVQLRGFKFMDTYALHNNFAEHQRGASVLAIIDPTKDARRTVMCFEDVEEGAEYLAWKRR